MSEVTIILERLGLSSFERKAYLFLLETGSATAFEISSRTEIPLGRIYTVMKQLESKGLIRIDRLNTPMVYMLNDPTLALRNLVDEVVKGYLQDMSSLDAAIVRFLESSDRFRTLSTQPMWDAYHSEDAVYHKVIPRLLEGSREEVLIVERNVVKIMTEEFLAEFEKTVSRGVVFKAILPPRSKEAFKRHSEFVDRVFGLTRLVDITSSRWGRGIMVKKRSVGDVAPFAVFDRSKVCFSIDSKKDGRYLLTLVTNAERVVKDFTETFLDLWGSSEDAGVLELLADMLKRSMIGEEAYTQRG